MKALSVCHPFAELLAQGPDVKPMENRSWWTSYRGPLLIHASKTRSWLGPDDCEAKRYGVDAQTLQFGVFVARADLYDCVPLESLPATLRWHIHANGPWCLLVRSVARIPNIPAEPGRFHQGLWTPTTREIAACEGDEQAQQELRDMNQAPTRALSRR